MFDDLLSLLIMVVSCMIYHISRSVYLDSCIDGIMEVLCKTH